MRRRQFITLLGGAAAAWPLMARAQQPAVPVVGLLVVASPDSTPQRWSAFRQGLAQAGYVEGKNVAIESRFAEGHDDRLPALAIELVSRRVNVIFAADNASAQMVKPASAAIPIVFSIGADPVALGLVASLNGPGGNITGVSFLSTAIMPKMLELMHDAVPNLATVALLVNPGNPQAAADIREAQEAARILGIELPMLNASNNREIEAAFAAIVERRAGALVIEGDGVLTGTGGGALGTQIIALSTRHALPTISRGLDFPRAGGLMGYGASIIEADRQAGDYVGRILKGEKPADLPVQRATKVELALNLKTAKALGITFPQSLLGRADEVIE